MFPDFFIKIHKFFLVEKRSCSVEESKILDLAPDLDLHQIWISSSLTHCASFPQVSWKSLELFFCNIAHKQTNKENTASLVEVLNLFILYILHFNGETNTTHMRSSNLCCVLISLRLKYIYHNRSISRGCFSSWLTMIFSFSSNASNINFHSGYHLSPASPVS